MYLINTQKLVVEILIYNRKRHDLGFMKTEAIPQRSYFQGLDKKIQAINNPSKNIN